MAIANQEMIRDNNRRQVLEYLVNHPPISRAALSQQLHLTKATISNIVQELIEQHLILEIGSAQTSLGRKPILLEFQKKCGYVLSIEQILCANTPSPPADPTATAGITRKSEYSKALRFSGITKQDKAADYRPLEELSDDL